MSSSSTQLDRLPPTTTAYVIATAILAGVTGYFIGQGSSLGLFSKERKSWPNSYNVQVHGDSSEEESGSEEDEEEEGDGSELSKFNDNTDDVKLVLVVRTDLGMTKGGYFIAVIFFFLSFSIMSNLTNSRENRRPMLPRYISLL